MQTKQTNQQMKTNRRADEKKTHSHMKKKQKKNVHAYERKNNRHTKNKRPCR